MILDCLCCRAISRASRSDLRTNAGQFSIIINYSFFSPSLAFFYYFPFDLDLISLFCFIFILSETWRGTRGKIIVIITLFSELNPVANIKLLKASGMDQIAATVLRLMKVNENKSSIILQFRVKISSKKNYCEISKTSF